MPGLTRREEPDQIEVNYLLHNYCTACGRRYPKPIFQCPYDGNKLRTNSRDARLREKDSGYRELIKGQPFIICPDCKDFISLEYIGLERYTCSKCKITFKGDLTWRAVWGLRR